MSLYDEVHEKLENDDGNISVQHSDAITETEDILLLAKAQRKLIFTAIFGVGLLIFSGLFFFRGLEDDTELPAIAPGNPQQLEDGIYAVTREGQDTAIVSYVPGSESRTVIDNVRINPADKGDNPSVQVSQDGDRIAYLKGVTNKTLVVRTPEKDVTIFSNINGKKIYDWVLAPYAKMVYVLEKDGPRLNLVSYDFSGKRKMAARDFKPGIGGQISGLHYSNDGTLSQYSVSGDGTVYASVYSLLSKEFNTGAVMNPGLPSVPRLAQDPVSPDGTFLLLTYDDPQGLTYELVSLNSRTSRDVALAAGKRLQAWLPNSLIVSHVTNDPKPAMELIDVGPKTSRILMSAKILGQVERMLWIDTGRAVLHMKDGTLRLLHQKEIGEPLFGGKEVLDFTYGNVKSSSSNKD